MQITLKQAQKTFLGEYPPDSPYRSFTDDDKKRLKDRLPPIILSLARQFNWCSFDRGILWLCDPDDWANVASPWLPPGRGKVDILARTSFGEFVVVRQKKYWLVLPHSAMCIRLSDDPNWIFGMTLVRRGYDDLAVLEAEHARARKKVGEIDWQQIYNYAPSLAFGGSRKASKIAAEDMVVALDILSQLAPVSALDD
jgi:hypothetical protein